MTFNIPTTKTTLYTTLQEIFSYYRIRRQSYTGVTLSALNLERQQFTPLTDEEIIQKATSLLAYDQNKLLLDKRASLEDKKSVLEDKVTAMVEEREDAILTLNLEYGKTQNKIEKEAKKKGLENSTIVVSKLAELADENESKRASINQKYNDKITTMQGEIATIISQISNLEDSYSQLFEEQTQAKIIELKDEQDKLEREIFQYNNGLHEKEQRSQNAIQQTHASLQLRYAEINATDFSKDQLIDMGYYRDAMDCVNGFYRNAFSTALQRYQDLANETKLALYLDDYYSEMLYSYKLLAGV